jgi:hypothetical protein
MAALLLLVVSIIALVKKSKNAVFFFIAFVWVLPANSFYAARSIGLVSDTFWANHLLQITSVAEVLLLSFALVSRINRLEIEKEKQAGIAQVAFEVSHDIRSPLAGLLTALEFIKISDESARTLVRAAVNGIIDQANMLLEMRKRTQDLPESLDSPSLFSSGFEFLPGLVEQAISVSRCQHKKFDLIHLNLPEDQLFIFSRLNKVIFKSILYNLIDNSAKCDATRIEVKLSTDEKHILVDVIDNGTGLTEKDIKNILNNRRKANKPKSNHLGIPSALKHIHSWNGELILKPSENGLTIVRIRLLRAETPAWFTTKIVMPKRGRILVLDDDTSIHTIWQQRLSSDERFSDVRIKHLSQGDLLENEIKSVDPISLFLIDHELIRQGKTGIDLISEFGIQSKSVLVTSRWDEKEIVDRCKSLGVCILPKFLAGKIPLEQDSSELSSVNWTEVFCILVDNNPGTRSNWIIAGKLTKKKILAYSSFNALKPDLPVIPKDMRICVDFKFEGEAIQGSEITKALIDLGFTDVYLVTGKGADIATEVPWLATDRIMGKEPFWLKDTDSKLAISLEL